MHQSVESFQLLKFVLKPSVIIERLVMKHLQGKAIICQLDLQKNINIIHEILAPTGSVNLLYEGLHENRDWTGES